MAALLVAIMHGEALLGAHAFDHAYLMVDLFFLMSGFVLSAGYGDRLAQGGGGRWFLQVRAMRLYPLAFVGLLLGLAANLLATHGPDGQTALMFVLAAAFMPWLGGGLLVPMNGPIWSLQVEFWANAAYGFVARWLTDARLAWIVGAAAVALGLIALTNGRVDGGFAHDDPVGAARDWSFLIGWARVCFAFPLGVLIHRMWRRRPGKVSPRSAPALVAAILVAVSLCPTAPWPLLDLTVLCLVFPALLLMAANAAPPPPVGKACAVLGRMSFGLYAIHAPIFLLARLLSPADLQGAGRVLLFAGALGVSVLLAMAAERWIDAPARRWAKRRMDGRTAASLATPARGLVSR